jgi:hypothetical protein
VLSREESKWGRVHILGRSESRKLDACPHTVQLQWCEPTCGTAATSTAIHWCGGFLRIGENGSVFGSACLHSQLDWWCSATWPGVTVTARAVPAAGGVA